MFDGLHDEWTKPNPSYLKYRVQSMQKDVKLLRKRKCIGTSTSCKKIRYIRQTIKKIVENNETLNFSLFVKEHRKRIHFSNFKRQQCIRFKTMQEMYTKQNSLKKYVEYVNLICTNVFDENVCFIGFFPQTCLHA